MLLSAAPHLSREIAVEMPSRKTAKGKARKAAKEAKAKEESQAVVTANQRQEGSSLEAQMQRLVINNATATPLKCQHD